MYRAFGWTPPRFGHLPLILNADGSKLSKRHNHLHISSLRRRQYYPSAILNFVTLVGGGFVDKEYSLKAGLGKNTFFFFKNLLARLFLQGGSFLFKKYIFESKTTLFKYKYMYEGSKYMCIFNIHDDCIHENIHQFKDKKCNFKNLFCLS